MLTKSRLGALLLALLLIALSGLTAGAYNSHLSDYGQPYYYGQTAWPTVHRDPSNSSYAPFVTSTNLEVKWTALDGGVTLLAPAIGPEGNLYVTTGRGPGHSHLHTFDRFGNLLWQSAPQVTVEDLDSYAVVSSPIVDREGDVYVSDQNQFWAFHPDGALKWVASLGERNPFISSIITAEGYVGGITANGQVILFQREDGSLAVPILDLPGGPGPVSPAVTVGLWGGGLMDPAIIPDVFAAFFGYTYEVVNTPAVNPYNGRIFITAAGSTVDTGRIYALDIVDGQLVLDTDFYQNCPFGGGSGTSPSLSPDGHTIYGVDGNRVMVACDTTTGQVLWTAGDVGKAAAPGVGPDGTVYTGGGTYLYALNPTDGSIKWQANFDNVASSFLPQLPPITGLTDGKPLARTNSVVLITAHEVWVVMSVGYNFTLPPTTGSTILQPRLALLLAVDPANGALKKYIRVRDTNEGIVAAGADGSIYLSHGSFLTSISYYGTNPSLPPQLRSSMMPVGGITALGPVSYLEQSMAGIDWIGELEADAQTAIAQGDYLTAVVAVQRARTQALATADSIADATDEGEVNHGHGTAAQAEMGQVEGHLAHARDILLQDNLTPHDVEQALHFIDLADAALARAVSKLQ